MFINRTKISSEHEDNPPTLTVLKPAVVIAQTDWKNASKSVMPGVVTNSVNVPKATMPAVARTIILVVNEICLVLRRIKLNTSVTTIKPIAPESARQEMTMFIVLLSAKFSRLLGHSEKPAVQNAETLWNMPYQAASKIPKS